MGRSDVVDNLSQGESRQSLAALLAAQNSFLVGHEHRLSIRPRFLFTGIMPLDLFFKPSLNSIIQVEGAAGNGKSSITCGVLAGACYRTCRRCGSPILKVPKDGQFIETCQCGEKARMRIVEYPTEGQMNEHWRYALGMDPANIGVISPFPDGDEAFFNTMFRLLSDDLIDVLIIDSLSHLVSGDTTKGDERVAGHSKMIAEGLRKLRRAVVIRSCTPNRHCAILWTNQFREDVNSSAFMRTFKFSGGKSAEYAPDYRLRLTGLVGQGATKAKYRTLKFDVKKSKITGPDGESSEFKLYLDAYNSKGGMRHAGETDSDAITLELLKGMGDPAVFRKNGNKIVLFDQDFDSLVEVGEFLRMEHNKYLIWMALALHMLPDTAKALLKDEEFLWVDPTSPITAYIEKRNG